MRIDAGLPPPLSLPGTAAARAPAPVAAVAPPAPAGLPAERVLQGELLARRAHFETLRPDEKFILDAATESEAQTQTPAEPANPAIAAYRNHSRNATLFAAPAGRLVDDYA
jgi:hypothetical protein